MDLSPYNSRSDGVYGTAERSWTRGFLLRDIGGVVGAMVGESYRLETGTELPVPTNEVFGSEISSLLGY